MWCASVTPNSPIKIRLVTSFSSYYEKSCSESLKKSQIRICDKALFIKIAGFELKKWLIPFFGNVVDCGPATVL